MFRNPHYETRSIVFELIILHYKQGIFIIPEGQFDAHPAVGKKAANS